MITHEFAQRLLRRGFITRSQVNFWQGQLPPDLPFNLAVASSTEVIGSRAAQEHT